MKSQLTEREGKALTYDAAGNLISDGANQYEWDARGQLSAISGATSASFAYDPFGRRVSKTLGGTTTGLLYDGPNVVQEYQGESLAATLLTGLGADQLFSRTTSAGTESYLTDRLGSTIALADASGELATTYTYTPFGKPSSEGAESGNSFQFTGRENDGASLQYSRARYYDPAAARFISPDPAGFAGSGPNLYAYVGGNPLDFVDPSGELDLPISIPTPSLPISIPSPPSPSDVLHAIRGAGSRIGDWVSGAPGVASDLGASLLDRTRYFLRNVTSEEIWGNAASFIVGGLICRYVTSPVSYAPTAPTLAAKAAGTAICLTSKYGTPIQIGIDIADEE